MADAERDRMLRQMAEHRGCKLVKSRRRIPGAGDYGRYGLKDGDGAEVFGFGKNGLTATAEEIEAWLRGRLASTWKQSIEAAPASKPGKPSEPRRAPPPAPKPVLKVREAASRDSEAIARLLAQLGFPTTREEVAKRLPQLRKAGEPVLVAEEKAVLGCLACHVMPVVHRPHPVGRITLLVVAADERGRGIGTALVEAAEERLRTRGCGLMEVTSNIELGGAHEFYKRRGYERTSYRFAKRLAD